MRRHNQILLIVDRASNKCTRQEFTAQEVLTATTRYQEALERYRDHPTVDVMLVASKANQGVTLQPAAAPRAFEAHGRTPRRRLHEHSLQQIASLELLAQHRANSMLALRSENRD